ncbi:NADPH-dependent 2,4-dienoyl-CoA reductase/sulfur reductase-like enzyme [Amycolatopsis lexingtonensis]|uniref:NADPH-dependent 2,4-dienoyl-CoA reductase/sulfur reductase-like enzyme n=1 Tax=Amycolatopsis lexingtonensis TaxID=218822 RepID=A0ABR9IH07_9PSEU|nr:FAD-dependent oxidoreductase [Amycolatopsis lexingtonensis]MBE1502474.1 NADPH-dependent 2,4-dienoyl-CoA reductase/sulfur reductase-like enzyme [Amycolatopsis lexingtonensis]
MTLVVVGASLAGLRAVEAARRTGYRGRIVLIGAEEHLPYDRPPLSKAFLADGGPRTVEPFHTEEVLREVLGVELLLGAPADGLDIGSREVTVAGTAVRYDALVIATGATARTLPGARALRTAEDAVAVRDALDRGARTVVIGAGFIGSEVASAARARGLPVTIVEAAVVPLARAVGETAGAALAGLHHEAGTELRLGTEVTGVTADGVHLAGGEVLPADLVVAGIGAVPATGWLEGSGLVLHERDRGVVCDATLSSGAPGVYAAGDVAHVASSLFGGLLRLEHWTNAAEQGAAAARHALDPAAARPLETVPYFWSDWYGHRIQFVGTPDADEVVTAGDTTLYRRGDRLVGALTVDRPREIMKHRRRIADRAHWADALAFAGTT